MSFRYTAIAALGLGTLTGPAGAGSARDQINIVGSSSTVFPFATAVAEKIGNKTKFKTPKIESTDSGGGMKLFCRGVGEKTPDVTNASRRMKAKEWKKCQAAGVKDVIEFKAGFDGIVMGNAKGSAALKLSREAIFLALAKQVPDPKGGEKLVANPYKWWSEVDPSLPNLKIEVLGPPPTSGTRDAFEELALEGGCKKFGWLKAMKKTDKKKYKKVCRQIREDGVYIESGENDNLIVSKLVANPKSIGVFGVSFLDQNKSKIKGALIDGVKPTFENIAGGTYPVSRSLFFYVKKANVGIIPGIKEYLAEWTANATFGDDGDLIDKGLIPLPTAGLKDAQSKAAALTVMTGSEELN